MCPGYKCSGRAPIQSDGMAPKQEEAESVCKSCQYSIVFERESAVVKYIFSFAWCRNFTAFFVVLYKTRH